MNRRDEVATATLQTLLASRKTEGFHRGDMAKQAVQITDELISELDRTAPEPTPDPYGLTNENVMAGSVLVGAQGPRLHVITVSYPLAVVRIVKINGELDKPQSYDLRANPMRCTVAAPEILDALTAQQPA